jgi:NAD(P)-dependent dehydrogenase (short-subunit alcohol dehydrogenase family)
MTKTSKKRIALITGANRGIGFEIARQLGALKMTVLIGARNIEKGTDTRDILAAEGANVHFVHLDVTDATTIAAALSKIKDNFGRLDVLVNNAGIMIDAHTGVLKLDPALLEKTLETNVFGPLLLSQACIPLMKEHGYGRIVNISSSFGSLNETAGPDSSYAEIQSPAYRLSKTLLNGLTVMFAKELQGTNIIVNSVCPGWVRTSMGGDDAPLSTVEAADTPVWLATLPDDGPTGGFFRERRPLPW